MADVVIETAAASPAPVVPADGVLSPAVSPPASGQPPDPSVSVKAEQPTPPPPAAPPPKDRMAERFAMLAKRERSVVERQQAMQRELATREAQLAAHERELAAERSRHQETTRLLESAKTDPKGLLRAIYGENYYDLITKMQLADDGSPPAELQVQAIREELQKTTEQLRKEQAALNERIEAQRKAAVESEKARLLAEMNEQLANFESEVVDFVNQNATKYELTNLYGRQDLVPQVIQAAYEQSKANGAPRLPSIEEAADVVESYLADEIAKAEQLKQRKAKAAQPADQPVPPVTPTITPSPTLTNAMSGTPGTPSGNPFDETQRINRALAVWDQMAKK